MGTCSPEIQALFLGSNVAGSQGIVLYEKSHHSWGPMAGFNVCDTLRQDGGSVVAGSRWERGGGLEIGGAFAVFLKGTFPVWRLQYWWV